VKTVLKKLKSRGLYDFTVGGDLVKIQAGKNLPPAKSEEKSVREMENKYRKREMIAKMRCPYGHTFGKDWDETKECSNCEKWDDCGDEYDKN